MWGRGHPSARADVMSSVGGDELNVSVALSRIDWDTQYASIIPKTVLGDIVADCATDAGVGTKYVYRDASKDAELGMFFVIPNEKRVQYQRCHSSFWRQDWPNLFSWRDILLESRGKDGDVWVHQTGITPLCGVGARENWKALMASCAALDVPISVDLNHRPALGSFATLWDIVGPTLKAVRFLVLSSRSLVNLGRWFGGNIATLAARVDGRPLHDTDLWCALMRAVHAQLKGPMLCVCFKIREAATQRQTRWSVAVDGKGVHTTFHTPVYHIPKDECGGGSAWSAGLIDRLTESDVQWTRDVDEEGVASFWSLATGSRTASVEVALRRADLLAALCQEERGDMSTVDRKRLSSNEGAFEGRPADITGGPFRTSRL